MKKGWTYKKLGEVCELYQPKTISTKEMVADGLYDVFGANGIIGKYHSYNHENSEILMTCRGATCGNINISTPKSWINGNAMVVHIKDEQELDMRFLVYSLVHIDKSHIITGAAQPQITRQTLSPLMVCYPSLSEQRSIVSRLDAAFANIDALKANAEKQLAEARALFQKALEEAMKPKEGWEEKRLKEISIKLFAGGDVPKDSFSKTKTHQYSIPIVSNGIEKDGLYGYTEFARVTEPAITISGRGTIGYVVERLEPFYPIIRLITIVPNPSIISTAFLYYALRNIDFSHSGSSIPQLTVPMVKDKIISIPSISVQHRIVSNLDSLSAKVRELEEVQRKTIAECDALKQAMLREVFE